MKLININSEFKNVAAVTLTSLLTQAITALILPILTRIYSPSDFAKFAIFTSILAIVGSLASLKFDIAISISDENDTNVLLVICLITSIISGLILFFIILIYLLLNTLNDTFNPYLNWYWMIPIGVIFIAVNEAFNNFSIRKSDFYSLSINKLISTIVGSTLQIFLGKLGILPLGLLVGFISKSIVGAILQFFKYRNEVTKCLNRFNVLTALNTIRKYRKFPRQLTLEAVANTSGAQVPILLLATLSHSPDAGYFMLAMSAMALPMSLIGISISQVFVSQAMEEKNSSNIAKLAVATIKRLFKIGVGPLIMIGIIAPELFQIFFGEKWQRSGDLVQWMTPWFILQFISAPIAIILHITNNSDLSLKIQIQGLIIRVIFVIIGLYIIRMYSAQLLAVASAIYYLLLLNGIMKSISISYKGLLTDIKAIFLQIGIWVFIGFCIKLTLNV